MNGHSIPFEELIKKRDNADRRYPACEQEDEPNILLLLLCSLFKWLKELICFAGTVLLCAAEVFVRICKTVLFISLMPLLILIVFAIL